MAKKWTRGSWTFPRATGLLRRIHSFCKYIMGTRSTQACAACGWALVIPNRHGPTIMELLVLWGEEWTEELYYELNCKWSHRRKKKSLSPKNWRGGASEVASVRERKYPGEDCLSWSLWHYLGGKRKEKLLEETKHAKVLWPEVVPGGFEEVKGDPCDHSVESEVQGREKWGYKVGRGRPSVSLKTMCPC